MRVLALDIWHDLRQKRLWPLAVLLLAAIVAALAFALRPGSEEPVPAPPAGAAVPGAVGDAGVRLTDQPLGGSSGLERFGSRDPFTGGPARPAEPGASAAGDAAGAPAAVAPGGDELSAPVSSPPSGGAAVSSPPAPPAPVGSSTPPGASSPPPQGERSDGPRKRRVVQKLRYFSHEADVVFGPAGSTRRRDGLEPLELLTENDPVLLFSGVTVDGKTAVFSLLRPELAVKGGCVEVLDRCQLLYMEEGERRRFEPPEEDPTGDAYVLRLVDIRTARIDP